MDEADKILLNFFNKQCNNDCLECIALDLCEPMTNYLADKGYLKYENGELIIKDEFMEGLSNERINNNK